MGVIKTKWDNDDGDGDGDDDGNDGEPVVVMMRSTWY